MQKNNLKGILILFEGTTVYLNIHSLACTKGHDVIKFHYEY